MASPSSRFLIRMAHAPPVCEERSYVPMPAHSDDGFGDTGRDLEDQNVKSDSVRTQGVPER